MDVIRLNVVQSTTVDFQFGELESLAAGLPSRTPPQAYLIASICCHLAGQQTNIPIGGSSVGLCPICRLPLARCHNDLFLGDQSVVMWPFFQGGYEFHGSFIE